MSAVRITHFSDVLCIWAYVGHRRLEELSEHFGDQVEIETRYCSVFPDAWGKIETKWSDRGGFAGFNAHLQDVAARFPHVPVHRKLWAGQRPRSSGSPHLFLKAIELIEQEDGVASVWLERLSTRAAWAVRRAFFEEARDISDWAVLEDLTRQLGIDPARVNEKIRNSEAVTQLAVDYHACSEQGVSGSPTLILNKGRQKLFGNVGYRLIEANVQELLRGHPEDEASWC